MHETTNYLYEVNVWCVIDPDKVSFVFYGDVHGSQTNPEVWVEAGCQLIKLGLFTASYSEPFGLGFLETVTEAELMANMAPEEARASFVTDPIQWVDGDERPLATPTGILVYRISEHLCELVDNNTNISSPSTFSMRLIVMNGGLIAWTPDPTIVNLPANPPS